MTYYPVIIPTLNRYEHFKECVESLAVNTHADKTELVIGFDYPPSEKYVDGWKKIKDYLPTITGFNKITIFERDYNFGAVKNSIDIREYVSKHYDAWIFTEDDNVFSPCFLDYMNKCLEKYKDDDSIQAICGFLQPTHYTCTSDIIKLNSYFSAWGYGTWKNMFEKLQTEIHVPGYRKYICSSPERLKRIWQYPRVAYHTLGWIKANPELDRLCDITYEANLIINNRSCIFPTISLVRNKGNDGSGINCGVIDPSKDIYTNQKISTEKIYTIDFSKPFNNMNTIELENFLLTNEPKAELANILKYIKWVLKYGLDKTQRILETRKQKEKKRHNFIEKIKATKLVQILLHIKHLIFQ